MGALANLEQWPDTFWQFLTGRCSHLVTLKRFIGDACRGSNHDAEKPSASITLRAINTGECNQTVQQNTGTLVPVLLPGWVLSGVVCRRNYYFASPRKTCSSS